MFINRKLIDTTHPKVNGWKSNDPPEKKVWGKCICGAEIYQFDEVWAVADFEYTVCIKCRHLLPIDRENHWDVAGLKLPDIALIG